MFLTPVVLLILRPTPTNRPRLNVLCAYKLNEINRAMSSIPLHTTVSSSSSGTATAGAAGLTFIDNSDLSVCEKIKLYFARNNNHQPAYTTLQSPTSSTSSLSPDFDASFKHMLEESRRRKVNKSQSGHQQQRKAMEQGADLLMNETTIDLCSSPESDVMDAAECMRGGAATGNVSPHLSAFNGTLFGSHDPRQRAVSRQLRADDGDSDDSLGVAELDDDGALVADEVPWYMERSDSDNSFLEHERECEREAEELDQLANLSCANETQLFDTEAPSMLWDQTIVNDTLPTMFALRKTNAMRARPSTIAEESTVNSSKASSAAASVSGASCKSVSPNEIRLGSYRESAVNVFPKRIKERPIAQTIQDSTPDLRRESSFDMFPKKLVARSFEPNEIADKVLPSYTYRESSMNVFPKKKARAVFESQSSLNAPSNVTPMQKPIIPLKPKLLTPTPVLSASASLHNTRNTPPKPLLKPKPVSPHRKSLALITFDDTLRDENSFGADDSDDSLNTARQFNDTIEAMDFFMERGQQLLDSAVKKSPSVPPPSATTPNLMHFSPKPINARTPDAIRRRLLMRNLLRSSQHGDSSTAAAPQFSHAEMMLRRSIQRMDDSLDD